MSIISTLCIDDYTDDCKYITEPAWRHGVCNARAYIEKRWREKSDLFLSVLFIVTLSALEVYSKSKKKRGMRRI